MDKTYFWLLCVLMCLTGDLYAQKSAQEVKSARDAMKKYVQVYEFAEAYADAAENMLQDSESFQAFFSKSASVVIDHPYWYYEPKGYSAEVSVAEYCQFFNKYHNRDGMSITGIKIRNMELENCTMEGPDVVFKVGIDKIVDFRDDLLQYCRRDTCREILYVRDMGGHLSIDKIAMEKSSFQSVRRVMKEAVARVTPEEISLESSPELQKQIKILMKIMKDKMEDQDQPRKRKSKGR